MGSRGLVRLWIPPARADASSVRTNCRLRACHAQWKGFDLHAGLLVPAGPGDRLERVCRYALRPPVTDERLRIGADRQLVLHSATVGERHHAQVFASELAKVGLETGRAEGLAIEVRCPFVREYLRKHR